MCHVRVSVIEASTVGIACGAGCGWAVGWCLAVRELDATTVAVCTAAHRRTASMSGAISDAARKQDQVLDPRLADGRVLGGQLGRDATGNTPASAMTSSDVRSSSAMAWSEFPGKTVRKDTARVLAARMRPPWSET